MDMCFPLNFVDSMEEDYHNGKINLIKNACVRPKLVLDYKKKYVIVIYESATVHIMNNQCDYFLEYLKSLGNQTWKDFADVLSNWKDLWSAKKLANIKNGCLDVQDDPVYEGKVPSSVNQLEEIHNLKDVISKGGIIQTSSSQKISHLKKLYYFERICKYSGDNMKSNLFILGYSFQLLEKLNIIPEKFHSQTTHYKFPIIIKPMNNTGYRFNLISQFMYGNFPRLNSEIHFDGPERVMVINPYATVNRLYTMKDEALRIRCTYSARVEEDMQVFVKGNSRKNEIDKD